MTRLRIKPYIDEQPNWPRDGQAILAQFDAQTVVVYQATGRGMGRWAVKHGRLALPGGEAAPGFSFERMSWLMTSFTWMMHRSAWATAPGQEAVLAIWLQRAAFDAILAQATHSRYVEDAYPSREAWQAAADASDVLAQWAPDYPPYGPKLRRRALQIGLRGEALRRFAEEWIAHVEDISEFARQQAAFASETELLFVPAQRVYPVSDATLARHLGLDRWAGD